jgi:hypothetical protein
MRLSIGVSAGITVNRKPPGGGEGRSVGVGVG